MIAEIEAAIDEALGGGKMHSEVPADTHQLPTSLGDEDLDTAAIHIGANRNPEPRS